MQLFVRCGVPLGTVAVECSASTDVHGIKEQLCQGDAGSQLGPPASLRLTYGGSSLPDDRLISDVLGLAPGATLHLTSRLRGGGGDGGSTGAESRSCYLEMYLGKKADKVNPAEELLARCTRCHVSGELLQPPCVIDELGYMYNKEAIIHQLINKTMPAPLHHISSLKHVMELKLHRSGPARTRASAQDSFQPGNDTEFSCPISGVPFNGRYKFVALRPSGVVVSEKALKEVPAAVEEVAGGKWAADDVIPINPTGEVLELQRSKLAARLGAERDRKNAKKAAKEAAAGGGASSSDVAQAGTGASAREQPNKRSASPPAEPGPANGGAAAKKVKAMEHMPSGATKAVFASIFTSSTGDQSGKESFCCRALSARGLNLT